ncbi:MAG: hypothetical protein DRJ96_08100 [Thermoprotei archaeon]|nr:MAG: hypothetical protein DRJ96_08100 [Thermoprotei archaeon]
MTRDPGSALRLGGWGSVLALLIILLVLASVLAAIYVASEELLERFLMEGSGSLEVAEAFWEFNDSIVEEVREGTLVHAVIRLSSSTGYDGYVEVKVRRDLMFLPDMTVALVRQYYVVRPGAKVEIRVAFRAQCSLLSRGYHVDVTWRGGKYTMPRGYPPRLKVLCGD